MLNIPLIDSAFKRFTGRCKIVDGVDRLISNICATICVFLALVTMSRQAFGQPINCWTPSEFKHGWDKYAEDYCYIQNSYRINLTSHLLPDHKIRQEEMVNYYQWVPQILFIQAIIFFIPSYLWTHFMKKNDDAKTELMIDKCERAGSCNGQELDDILANATITLLDTVKEMNTPTVQYGNWYSMLFRGSKIALYYVLMKIVRLLVCVGQLLFVIRFLRRDTQFWQINRILDSILGYDWVESPVFPRITMCDFKTLNLGNIHEHSTQCLLTMNIVYEKIFLFEWCLFLVICVVAVGSLLERAVRLLPSSRKNIIRTWLSRVRTEQFNPSEEQISKFVTNLRPDGFIVLNFIEAFHGPRTVARCVRHIFYPVLNINFAKSRQSTVVDAPPIPSKTPAFNFGSDGTIQVSPFVNAVTVDEQ